MGNAASTTVSQEKKQLPLLILLKPQQDAPPDVDLADCLTAIFRPERMDASLAGWLWKSRKAVGKLMPDPFIYPKWRQDMVALADLSVLIGQVGEEQLDGPRANRIAAIFYSFNDLDRLVHLILGLGGAVRVLGRIAAILAIDGLSLAERHGLIVRAVEARLEVLEGLYQHLDLFRSLGFLQHRENLNHAIERCRTGICLLEGLLETVAVHPNVKELSVILFFLLHQPPNVSALTRAAQRETEEGIFRFMTADLGLWMVVGGGEDGLFLEAAHRMLKRLVEADALGLILCPLELKATLFYLFGRTCILTGRPVAGVEHLRRAGGILYGLVGEDLPTPRQRNTLQVWEIIKNGPGSLCGLLAETENFDLIGYLYHCVLIAQAAKSTDAAIQLAKFAMRVSQAGGESMVDSSLLGIERLGLVQNSQSELHLVLGTVIIVGLIEERRFLEAYESLHLVPEAGDRRRDCLRRLIVAICEAGQAQILGQLPLISWLGQVERILLLRAREMPLVVGPSQQPNYYKILYSFHANRGDYRSAANALYQYADRLRSSTAFDIEAVIDDLVLSLNLVMTSLRLVAPEFRWLAFAKPNAVSRVLCLIDMDVLRGEAAIALAIQRLLKHYRFKGNPLHMTDAAKQHRLLLGLLTEAHDFRGAIELAQRCKLDWTVIFASLTDQLLGGKSVNTFDWLIDDWFEGRTADEGVAEVLKEAFDHCHHSPIYYRVVLERLCQKSTDNFEQLLPHWFYDWFMANDPDQLVRLCLRHGKVQAACQYAISGLSIRMRPAKARLLPTTVDAVLGALARDNQEVAMDQLRSKWNRYSRLLLNFE